MKILLTKSIVALLLLLPCLTLQAQTYSKITYIHSDADGTPFAATDEQGNLAWQLDHYPYGDEYRNTSDERANDTSFAGKAYDSEIGLSYFGSRWYDPAIGRFASIDPRPITPEDYRTFNRYAYGFNNLYKYVDPDGRFAFLIPVVIWAGKTLTITGAGLSGYAVGSNGYDLYSGRKSAGEAARDAAIDVGIALTLKGAGGGLLKAGERFGESIGNATKGGKDRIKVKDVTNPGRSKPNFEVDKTKGQFEDHLTNNGFDKSVIPTPKGPINVFSKNGQKEFTTRDFSRSTNGPSGEIFKNGKQTGKIRFPGE